MTFLGKYKINKFVEVTVSFLDLEITAIKQDSSHSTIIIPKRIYPEIENMTGGYLPPKEIKEKDCHACGHYEEVRQTTYEYEPLEFHHNHHYIFWNSENLDTELEYLIDNFVKIIMNKRNGGGVL